MRISWVLKLILIWQTAIIAVTAFSSQVLPLREAYLGGATQAYLKNPFLYSRANFDGNYYIYISERGYGYALQAFFPFYPEVIKLFRPLFDSSVSSGVFVSLFSFTLGLIVLHKLIRLDYQAEISKYAVLAIIFFPVSFFFSFVYTEGLFFLLSVSSFYFARKKNWLLAGILGGLAAYTRFVGVFLFPCLLIEWWHNREKSFKANLVKLLPLLLIPVGLLTYMNFLNRSVGDPLAFYHVQKHFGQERTDSKIVLLYQVFWRYIKMLATVNRYDPLYLTIVLEAATGVLFLTTSIFSFIKLRRSYALYNLALYLTPTITGSFTSLPRYMLVSFSSFILFALFLSRISSINRRMIALASAVIYFVFLTMFVRGYWVA